MRPLMLLAATLTAAACAGSSAARRAVVPDDAGSAVAIAPARSTYCNPLDLDYRFALDTPSRRDAADPVIVRLDSDYYLFASNSGGYWHSRDMRAWALVKPEGLPAIDSTPAVLVRDGRAYYTASESMALYTSDAPASGQWRKAAPLARYADPAFFADADGRVYLYYRTTADDAIAVVQLDPADVFNVVGAPRDLVRARGVNRPWMTKRDGRYYLELSGASADGSRARHPIFVSSAPAGPFTEIATASSALGASASATTGGRSSTFLDRGGRLWRATTIVLAGARGPDRRLGIVPMKSDGPAARELPSRDDYPLFVPDVADTLAGRDAPAWTLLSGGKSATASSSLGNHPPALAFDEDESSWWSATSGGVGEWLEVDLGSIVRITAIQINFAEQDTHALGRDEDSYQQYIVESSIDGSRWTTRLDESTSTRDAPHHYVQLDTARNARYVRITNVHAAAGGMFALRGLRIFGVDAADASRTHRTSK